MRPLRNSRRYPAYVSWETYEEIQRTLRDNHAEYTKHKTRGIPREGAAVLHGITYCGVCGYKMRVQYSPEARYICNYHQTQQPGSGVCQNLPAEEIDKAVVNAFFAALQPAELDLYSEALQAHQDQAKELVAAQQRELQRLQYEADLARRQYDRVDPDNRLVAGELERRWEAALRELRETEQRMRSEQQARDNVIALHVPQKLRESFSALGERLPKIWSSPLLHQAQRKALLRCLVDKVVLHRCDAAWETVRVRVVWRGGAVTAMDVPVPVATASRLSTMDQLRSRLLALKAEGLSDRDIAQTLTDEGFRSPRRNRVSPAAVKRIRLQAGRTCDDQGPMLRDVPGALTVRQLAEVLHVKPMWIYSRIRRGTIEVQRDASTRRYLFPDQPTVLKELEELKAGDVARVKIVSIQGASR